MEGKKDLPGLIEMAGRRKKTRFSYKKGMLKCNKKEDKTVKRGLCGSTKKDYCCDNQLI
jgi:hypothetical protein